MISVHLQIFPNLNSLVIDEEIVNTMDQVREVCNCISSLRKEANIRVRMPLKKITICGQHNFSDEYLNLIKQETNIKTIECFNNNLEEIATKEVVLNMKECGKMFGSKLKEILIAQRRNEWSIENGKLKIADYIIPNNMFSIIWKAKDGSKTMQCEHFNLLVIIDTELTQELIIEGLARDVIRIIQQTRKDNKLAINDNINVVLHTKNKIFNEVLDVWKTYICDQTLAKNIYIDNKINDNQAFSIDEYKFSLDIEKII